MTAADLSTATLDFLRRKHGHFIAGRWVPSASGRSFDVHDPATGLTIASCAAGDAHDIDLAVKAARAALEQAAAEETDHLAWTEARIHALGGRKSWLNPIWYAGAFALAYATAKVGGERVSLGFVVETERQVEAHLHSHLVRLPAGDTASLAVVKAMAHDEAQHAREAQRAGAAELPEPLKRLMALSGRVMTTVAHRV